MGNVIFCSRDQACLFAECNVCCNADISGPATRAIFTEVAKTRDHLLSGTNNLFDDDDDLPSGSRSEKEGLGGK